MADNINLDTETLAVLARFNDGLERIDAADRRERAVKNAEKAKDEAATKLRAVEADGKASAETKTSAQEAYRAAVDSWQDIKRRADAGEDIGPTAVSAGAEPDDADEPEAPGDDTADSTPDSHDEDTDTPVEAEATDEPVAVEPVAEEPAADERAAEPEAAEPAAED